MLLSSLTFAITTRITLAAAFFVDESRLAAGRADIPDFLKLPDRKLGLNFLDFGLFFLPTKILFHNFGNPIRQGTDFLGAETHRPRSPDSLQLVDDRRHPLFWLHRRIDPQNERGEPTDRLGVSRNIRTGLTDVDKDLQRIAVPVFIDGHKSASDRGIHPVGRANGAGRPGLYRQLPLSFLLGLFGLQNHLFARSGDVNGQTLAAQLPRLQIRLPHVFDGGVRGEIAGFRDRVIDKTLEDRLHLDVLFGGDVLRNDKDSADPFRNLFNPLHGPLPPNFFVNIVPLAVFQPRFLQRPVKHRTGVRELPLSLVLTRRLEKPPYVGEGENRLAAVSFRPGDRGNRSGRRDRGLGPVPNSMLFDPRRHRLPVNLRPAKISFVRVERGGGLPNQFFWIVNRTLDLQERLALPGQIDRSMHRVVADKLHDLRRQFQSVLSVVGNPQSVHHIGKPHDPQPDPPHRHCRFPKLGNFRNIGVRFYHIVQKDG